MISQNSAGLSLTQLHPAVDELGPSGHNRSGPLTGITLWLRMAEEGAILGLSVAALITQRSQVQIRPSRPLRRRSEVTSPGRRGDLKIF